MKIGSIILAGGSSTRMGSPKALIKINGVTFLETIVNKHHDAGIEKPIVLISDFLEPDILKLSIKKIELIVCSPPEKTPIESLRRGIARLAADEKAFIVHPIDFPLPLVSTIKLIIDLFEKSGKAIVKPIYDGKGGHPIIMSCSLIEEIIHVSEDIGLREVVRKFPERVLEYPTKDVGVINNINTLEDLTICFKNTYQVNKKKSDK
jgi:molybdenum cofactor cytidylyltransferase